MSSGLSLRRPRLVASAHLARLGRRGVVPCDKKAMGARGSSDGDLPCRGEGIRRGLPWVSAWCSMGRGAGMARCPLLDVCEGDATRLGAREPKVASSRRRTLAVTPIGREWNDDGRRIDRSPPRLPSQTRSHMPPRLRCSALSDSVFFLFCLSLRSVSSSFPACRSSTHLSRRGFGLSEFVYFWRLHVKNRICVRISRDASWTFGLGLLKLLHDRF